MKETKYEKRNGKNKEMREYFFEMLYKTVLGGECYIVCGFNTS